MFATLHARRVLPACRSLDVSCLWPLAHTALRQPSHPHAPASGGQRASQQPGYTRACSFRELQEIAPNVGPQARKIGHFPGAFWPREAADTAPESCQLPLSGVGWGGWMPWARAWLGPFLAYAYPLKSASPGPRRPPHQTWPFWTRGLSGRGHSGYAWPFRAWPFQTGPACSCN